jgi:hypothetical protein
MLSEIIEQELRGDDRSCLGLFVVSMTFQGDQPSREEAGRKEANIH